MSRSAAASGAAGDARRGYAGGSARRLLELLARGGLVSGSALAAELGITRAAVWKLVRTLQAHGVDIEAVHGHGYRLMRPVRPLDAARIRALLAPDSRRLVESLEVAWETDSTNEQLLRRAASGGAHGHVLLAEHQHQGRGRRGRDWVSPLGAGVWMSVGWRMAAPPAGLGALAAAMAVAVHGALGRCGVGDLWIKWPNDLLWQGRKLAGVLIELHGQADGPLDVVVGVGVNADLPPAAVRAAGGAAVDLRAALGGTPDRDAVAASVAGALLEGLAAFEAEGFAPELARRWRRHDALGGREVRITGGGPQTPSLGRAMGIDRDGALLIEAGGRVQRVLVGDVTVRAHR